jgi:hypothetical protein
MKLRQSLAVGVPLILGMGLSSVLSWQPSFAQQKAEQATVGRYQVAAFGRDQNNGAMIVIDTATEHCWKKLGLQGAQWEDMGVPPLRQRVSASTSRTVLCQYIPNTGRTKIHV